VLDHAFWRRRASLWRGGPHQLSAQTDGRLAEDDRAQHQLKQDPVEFCGDITRTLRAGLGDSGRNAPAAVDQGE
jgi:hypothetical protein